MKQIKIQDYNIIHGVPPVLDVADRVAIDTEFSQMNSKKLHRPTGVFSCATFYAGGKDVYIVEDVRDLATAMQNVEQAGFIFHNAKFDIFHLRRFVAIPTRMKMWDTMLVEQVMYSGLYDEFNLAACVRRHLDTLLEKETREEFETHSGEMTPSQVEYACIDTIATHQLFQHQRSIIDADDLKIWKEIELPFLWTLLSIGGITLDQEKWLAIAKDNGEKADAIQAKYGKEVQKISEKTGKPLKATTFDGINLASPKQVKEEFARLGFTLDGTGEEIVSLLVEKCEFAKELLDFRTLSKRAGTYGESYIADHVEADGKIYTDYFQIGAISSRLSSRSPNLQNQPREGGYRDCYVAQDDEHELVIADSIAQEPKFTAFLCQDEGLIDALNSKEKLYIRVARDAMGIEVKKGEELYNHMKSTILGLIYGMSADGLADRIGKTREEAQEMINAIKYTAYPKLGKWIDDNQSEFKPYVTTVSRRKVWLNEYTNAWRRLILNAPIQGSAAEAFKLAVISLVKDWHGSLNVLVSVLRLFVHDEIVAEILKTDFEKFAPVLERAMISASESLHPGISAGVELGHGSAWSSKI
jgi:DNA polymerase-1